LYRRVYKKQTGKAFNASELLRYAVAHAMEPAGERLALCAATQRRAAAGAALFEPDRD